MVNLTKNISDTVRSILEKDPRTRDNDPLLISIIWWREIPPDKRDLMYTREFLRLFSEAKLTNSETIRRTRQKLQEENKSLRGVHYKDRLEKVVQIQTQIKYEPHWKK
jgi:hypothetical protein